MLFLLNCYFILLSQTTLESQFVVSLNASNAQFCYPILLHNSIQIMHIVFSILQQIVVVQLVAVLQDIPFNLTSVHPGNKVLHRSRHK